MWLLACAWTVSASWSGSHLGCSVFWRAPWLLGLLAQLSGRRFWLKPWLCGLWLAPWLFRLLAHALAVPDLDQDHTDPQSATHTRTMPPKTKKKYIYIYICIYSPHSTRDNNIGARHVRGGQQVSRDKPWYGHPCVIAILHEGSMQHARSRAPSSIGSTQLGRHSQWFVVLSTTDVP